MMTQNISDMRRTTLKVGAAQLRFVTEIALKSSFLCVKRSPIRYGFRDGAKAIGYTSSVNIGLTAPHQNRQLRSQDKSSIIHQAGASLNISTMLVQLYAIMSLAAVCVVSLITSLNGVWHCWIMFEKLSTGLHEH